MNRSLRIKITIVCVIILGSLYFLYPTFKLWTMPAEERELMAIEDPEKLDVLHKKAIKLGLDLSGGMHLVLEVDDSQLEDDQKRDVVIRALEVIRNRVDQFGVSEPSIQREGTKRIIVQLPGLQDAERAKRLIGQTAMLEWRLIRQEQEYIGVLEELDKVLRYEMGDSLVEVGAETSPDSALSASQSDSARTSEDMPDFAAFDTTFAADSLASPFDQMPEIPLQTVDKTKPFTSLIASLYHGGLLVLEDNIPKINRLLATPKVMAALPEDSEFMWYEEWQLLRDGDRGKLLFLIAKDIFVSGANLDNATHEPDPTAPNRRRVAFTFNRRGARELARFTGENVGRLTAIILDGKIRSYPVIRSKIPGGRGVIEGTFTDEEARDLSIVLRAGALPAPMFTREERTVGPSLGADSIRMGIRAALLGIAIVVIFMLIYYRISGAIAIIALMLSLLILFGLLAYLGAALTLPGIAGIILTIGMAIDANVLIFERIREELAKAKTIRSAIDAGYDRAFTTILDANLTTLITAVVLWQFGTGPVKGFATTLSIGIVASMFSALVFSRMIFELWTRSGRVKKLSI